MRLHYFLLLSTITFSYLSIAQVKTNFNNPEKLTEKGKFKRNYKSKVDLELPEKDLKQLLTKELGENKDNTTKPLRIAEAIEVDIDIAKQMKWDTDDLFAYGKYIIKANGALSLSINFNKFYLPKGSELYVYNKEGEMITGPVSEAENTQE